MSTVGPVDGVQSRRRLRIPGSTSDNPVSVLLFQASKWADGRSPRSPATSPAQYLAGRISRALATRCGWPAGPSALTSASQGNRQGQNVYVEAEVHRGRRASREASGQRFTRSNLPRSVVDVLIHARDHPKPVTSIERGVGDVGRRVSKLPRRVAGRGLTYRPSIDDQEIPRRGVDVDVDRRSRAHVRSVDVGLDQKGSRGLRVCIRGCGADRGEFSGLTEALPSSVAPTESLATSL